jgi:hypothetical protein
MNEKSSILLALVAISCLVVPSINHTKPLEEINPGSNIMAVINGAHLQAIMLALKSFPD